MEYHCGNCNAQLDDAALDSGICPTCGAKISPFGDVIEAPPTKPLAIPDPAASWPNAVLEPPAETAPVSGPLYTNGPLENTHARLEAIRASRSTGRLADLPAGEDPLRRLPRAVLIAAMAGALALVLLCTIAVTGTVLHGITFNTVGAVPTQTHKRTTPAPTQPISLGFPTQNPDPTPLPFQGTVPTAEPTSTPFGGPPTPTPKPSPTAGPSVTPTPGPDASQLQVSPLSAMFHCPSLSHNFTVGNGGTADLNWSATASDPQVTVNPLAGVVPAGQPPVQVSIMNGTTHPVQVTFTDASGASGPVTVNIGCK